MVAEALQKGLISKASSVQLRDKPAAVRSLSEYWKHVDRLLSMNLLFLATTESLHRDAHAERILSGLLTNDSRIVACMRRYGVTLLASRDSDFERVTGIEVFQPQDLP